MKKLCSCVAIVELGPAGKLREQPGGGEGRCVTWQTWWRERCPCEGCGRLACPDASGQAWRFPEADFFVRPVKSRKSVELA